MTQGVWPGELEQAAGLGLGQAEAETPGLQVPCVAIQPGSPAGPAMSHVTSCPVWFCPLLTTGPGVQMAFSVHSLRWQRGEEGGPAGVFLPGLRGRTCPHTFSPGELLGLLKCPLVLCPLSLVSPRCPQHRPQSTPRPHFLLCARTVPPASLVKEDSLSLGPGGPGLSPKVLWTLPLAWVSSTWLVARRSMCQPRGSRPQTATAIRGKFFDPAEQDPTAGPPHAIATAWDRPCWKAPGSGLGWVSPGAQRPGLR